MHITELFLSAFSGLNNNRKRTLLTIFSIVIGIASVITIISVGQGLKKSINDELGKSGVDLVTIINKKNDRGVIDSEDTLKLKDIPYLKNYKPVLAVAAQQSIVFREAIDIPNKDKARDVNLTGVNEDFFKTLSHNILYGRTILKQDVDSMSMVAVITSSLSKSLFGTENSIGKKLILKTSLGRLQFTVIGVEEDYSNTSQIFNIPTMIMVPISYIQMFKNNDDTLYSLIVKVNSTKNVSAFGNNIVRFLEIKNNTSNAYEYLTLEAELNQINSIISIFTIFLTSVASISLIVGGVGVMNIMLVSVTERTKEIGIRKSLGATNSNIKFQFLVESSILSGIGGIIGILLGLFQGFIITSVASAILYMKIAPSISMLSVIVILTISCSIGILFGVYPAGKAAKLDPVESLRFE